MQQPLSLYIQLEKGQLANIECVAKAALSFSEAVKEAAFIIDPSMEVEVCLLSGTEGSLDLNTFIRAIKDTVLPADKAEQKARLKAIVVGVLGWFAMEGASWSVSKILDHFTQEEKADLSDEAILKIAEKTAEIIERKAAKPQVQAIFVALSKDPAVTGVGISQTHATQPDFIVPKSDFPNLSGLTDRIEQQTGKRTIEDEDRVVLISPVLIQGTKRRWKVLTRFGEIGATMADFEFQEALYAGQLPIPLRAGIEMDVTIQTTQERIDGIWTPTEYKISKVHKIHSGEQQPDLIL